MTALPLNHMNLSPVLMEPDFIHQLVNQENPSTMMGINVLALTRIGNIGGVKTRSRIAYNDKHALMLIAGHVALHNF